MTVKTVSQDSFTEDVINSSTPVLVDFWASWCGPCLQMSPILDQFATEKDGAVTVAKVNVDENPDLAMAYHITSIPAMKLFKDGAVVKDLVGTRPKAVLESELAPFID